MKKLLSLLFCILRSKIAENDCSDDAIFQHLDGAEFSVVVPPAAPVSAD
jgi:hypothetical protein